MQYQAALQLAAQAPGLYDLPMLHRQMMELIGIPNADKIVPSEDEGTPVDPVTENQNILTMKPVKSFEWQDHQAHLNVHMTLKNDPQFGQEVQNTQLGGAKLAALDAHVSEHLGFLFRSQIEEELGAPLPPMGEPLPADIEKRLSTLVSEAASQLLGKKQQQQEMERIQQQQQDPIIQQRQQEIDIRAAEVQRKQMADQQKMQLEQQKLAAKVQKDAADTQIAEERLALDEETQEQKLDLEEAKITLDAMD
jgi:hypothetical protein